MGWFRNLVVKITGDKSGLDSSLKGAESSISRFGGAVKKIGAAIAAAFTVGAVVAFGKQIINASEVLSDKFTAAVAGAKGAIFEFFNKLASADFKNFVSDIKEAYKSAKGLTEEFDKLSDTKAFTEYITTSKRAESAEAQEVLRNLAAKPEDRKKAAETILSIEKEILDKSQGIARMQFNLEKKGWEDRNKMAADMAKEMFTTISGWDQKTIDKLDEAFAKAKKDFSARTPYIKMTGTVAGRTGITRDAVNLYAEYLKLQKGEEDVIPKLFAIYSDFNNANITAQERYNSLLRYTSGLLKEQGIQVEKITKDKGVPFASTSNIGAAEITGLKELEGLQGPPKWIEDSTKAMEDQIQVAEQLEETLYNLFTSTKDGWSGMLDAMLTELTHYVAKAIAKYIALAIIKTIAGELPVASISNITMPKLSNPLPGLQAPRGLASAKMEFKIHGKDLKTVLQRAD